MHRFILIYLMIFPLLSFAQEKTLEQLEQEKNLNKAISEINRYEAELDLLIETREIDCIQAIGYKPFCDCIMKDLPIAWSFKHYIAITTGKKEENGYSKMNEELKKAYDSVSNIRNKCVHKINLKH